MTFTNLHAHSLYSHDAISKIEDMVKFAKDNNQRAIAITDHGNMSGAIDLIKECKRQDIIPIVGNEMYICKEQKLASVKDSTNRSYNHIVLLAKNEVGYKNLLKLASISNANYYYKPRIDEKTLFEHKEGLIVINGHIQTSLCDCLFYDYEAVSQCRNIDEARNFLLPDYESRWLDLVNRYIEHFGEDFYAECQLFDREDIVQQSIGVIMHELAQKHGVKAVGTGDAHYIKPGDQIFHKTFVAISRNTKVDKMIPCRYLDSGMYGLITNEAAEECYPEDLINATQEIVDKIEEYNVFRKEEVPKFAETKEQANEMLREMCQQGMRDRGLSGRGEYESRLEYEHSVIEEGGLSDYFLIVADYINWTKSQGMLIGPGRGSSGGSLLSYTAGITTIDPIEYDLIFERFYSPDRAEFGDIPDIDTDFPVTGREKVINYLSEKYGEDKVCGVITFSTLQGRGALKDVLRVHSKLKYHQIDEISKLVPQRDKISDKMSDFKKKTGSNSILLYTLMEEPDILEEYCTIEEDGSLSGEYARYFEIAIGVEGLIKSSSKHASAILISSHSISDLAPMVRDKNSDNLICGYSMGAFEPVGLVKFDILGLKNLDCLMEVNNLLKEFGL